VLHCCTAVLPVQCTALHCTESVPQTETISSTLAHCTLHTAGRPVCKLGPSVCAPHGLLAKDLLAHPHRNQTDPLDLL